MSILFTVVMSPLLRILFWFPLVCLFDFFGFSFFCFNFVFVVFSFL